MSWIRFAAVQAVKSAARRSRAAGVQRDLLPLVEGTAVSTRYGLVRTDHILFIAAGSVHGGLGPATSCPSCRGASRSVSSCTS